jgi:CubicO group peptidase (beta-lactamase class C family)
MTATLFTACKKDSGNNPDPTPPPVTQKDIASIDTKIADWMTKNNMPGMTIAISKNGKMVYSKAYGKGDKEANTAATTDSKFRIASVSKLITSVAVLKLVQDGKISMTQKVFGNGAILGTTYGSKAYSANVQAITISDLLHHTGGGWGNEVNDPAFFISSYGTKETYDYTLDNLLIAAPGSVFNYSNFGYMVLARVIEKVSGKTYEQFVKDEILTKVGATNTSIAGNLLTDRKPGEVKYYGQGGDAPFVYDMNLPRGDGAMGWVSTATDLLRFATAVDSSSTRPDILNGATLQLMATPTAKSIGFGWHFGCGWVVEDGEWFWWGSLPGTFGFLYRNVNGICIAALANSRLQPNPNNGLNSFFDVSNYIAFETIPWQDIDQFK